MQEKLEKPFLVELLWKFNLNPKPDRNCCNSDKDCGGGNGR